MRILAIESSGLVASVAVIEDGSLLAEYTVNYKKTHSETLLPMIGEVMRMLGADVGDTDAIAVSAGPGSFTGLRIGAATAKGLALALGIPLIPVPTVDSLAYNFACTESGLIVPVMDARRSQVYTGIYRFRNGEMEILHEQWCAELSELTEILNEYHAAGSGDGPQSLCTDNPVTFLGDGVPVYGSRLRDGLRADVYFAQAHQDRQRASSVGALAAKLYAEGKSISGDKFVPEYLRLSQAERERLEKERLQKEQAGKTAGDSAADNG